MSLFCFVVVVLWFAGAFGSGLVGLIWGGVLWFVVCLCYVALV